MGPHQSSPEQFQAPQPRVEQATGDVSVTNLEVAQNFHEKVEQRPGVAEASAQVTSVMPVATLPTPVAQDDVASPVQSDNNPVIAADEDLIEKEWVDRAKQIIAKTKDDPYAREQEIKALKIDYVKKRYGKVIGATDD